MATTQHAKLEREVEACLAAALPDVDLREFMLVGSGGETMIRITVDHPDGVDHDLCERVTKAMWAEGLGDDHGIEVWSPGPEPPLRVRRHYDAARGHRVRLKIASEGGGKARDRVGVLSDVGDDGVTLVTADGARQVPFEQIRRAYDLEPEGPGE
ncbi:MAG: hypothetical protein KDC33_04255 [Thermoleophilia bacterium]|nr:hypothetical protein [Thermoleophilia bacterium]